MSKRNPEPKPKASDAREINLYMAGGIEKSARDCIRDGYVEKGERMLAWANALREEARWIDHDGYPIIHSWVSDFRQKACE